MAKELDFQEYSATITDDDGDEHTTTVRAAVITDDLVYLIDPNTGNKVRREVKTPTGGRQVSLGDVYVETERPGIYDYLTGEAWATTGYGGVDDTSDETPKPVRKRKLPDEPS